MTSLLIVLGVVCAPHAGATTTRASYSGGFEVLGGTLTYPSGITEDASGNVYLAMPALNEVQEIPASCINGANDNECVVTLGSGFSQPYGVAVDSSGNVYVADTDNDAVKVIKASCITPTNTSATDASCIVTLNAGAFKEPYGVAVDGNKNVYITDTFQSSVKMITAGCVANAIAPEDPTPCTTSSTVITTAHFFAIPIGIAADAIGNIYVADASLGNVYSIPASCITSPNTSACVTTLGGGFDTPFGLSVDKSGNVFVADIGNSTIKEIPSGCTTSGCVVPLGGGFDTPYGVAVDANDNVYVADTTNFEVKKLWLQGANFGSVPVAASTPALRTMIFTFTQATNATIQAPVVVTGGGTSLDFTDAGTGSCTTQGTSHNYNTGDVCTVDVNFTPLYPGERNGAVLLKNSLGAVLANGFIYGVGTAPQITFANTTSGSLIPNSITPIGSGFSSPVQLAVDGSGNIFVADQTTGKVYKIPAEGGSPITIVTPPSNPAGVALDGAGNLYYTEISGESSGAVYELAWAGGLYNGTPRMLASGFDHATGLAVDTSGNVFVTAAAAGSIWEIQAVNGVIPDTPSVVRIASATAFGYPFSLAVDASGNVFEVGWDNKLREITKASGYTTVNNLANFSGSVKGVALDAAGDAYVVANNSIYEVMASGGSIPASPTINTVGSGFSGTMGVALDGLGNVYVSDANHSQVKKLDFVDPPTLNFNTTSIGFTSSDSPQTVTVYNDGNQPLIFTALSMPGDFSFDSYGEGVCTSSTTLVESGNCYIPIDFTPESTGEIGENLTLTDDNLNVPASPGAQQSISLNSNGNPAPDATSTYVSVTPSSINSGQTVNISATIYDNGVREGTPGGTVTFSWTCVGVCTYDTSSTSGSSSGSLNSGNPVSLSAGVATLTGVSFPIAGTYTVTASYSGVSETFQSSDNSGQSDGSNQTSVSWAAATATAPAATNIGTVSIGSAPVKQTVQFTIQTAGSIGTPVVLTQGATGKDFTDAGDGSCSLNNGGNYGYNATETCTVDVQFSPSYPGTRMGAVLLKDTSGNVLATAYIHGLSTGPMVSFAPATSSTLAPLYNGGTASTGFNYPTAAAMDGSGNIFIADTNNSRIKEITSASAYTTVNILAPSYTGGTASTSFDNPYGIAVDGAGNVFVADTNHAEVKEITAASGYTTVTELVHGSFSWPSGLAVDGSGNLYVLDSGSVYKITAASNFTSVSTLKSGLGSGYGIAVDGSANIFVSEFNANDVKEITFASGYTTVDTLAVSFGSFHNPMGLAVDAGGNVYVTSYWSDAVYEIASAGGYTTVTQLISGMAGPLGVVLDPTGNLIVPASGNTVNKLDISDAPSLSFDETAIGFSSDDSPQTVTVINQGNASLSITGLSYAGDFPQDNSDEGVCNTGALFAGATCTLPIDFTPQGSYPYSTQTLNESLTVSDDNLNTSISQNLSLSGTATAPTVNFNSPESTTLTSGTVGVSYSVSFTATGGAGPYTYHSPWVPDGLSLSSGGTLSGFPTKAKEDYHIYVTATDANGFKSGQRYTLTIHQGTATITITPYNLTYDATQHTASITTAHGYNALDLSSGVNLSGTQHTAAATYNGDAWSFHDSNGNYADQNGTVNDVISQATASISVTGYTVTYDGSAHTASATATGVGSVNLFGDLDLSATTHTNAGIYNGDAWTFTDPNGNYASTGGTVDDVINIVAATASSPAATNLGSANIGASNSQTVTFTFATAGSIGAPVVVTQGAQDEDFTDVGDGTCSQNNGPTYGYPATSTCTVDVDFTPQAPGPRYGAVLLEDNNGNILAMAYLYGMGTGSLINFAPGTQSTVSSSGMNQTDDVAADANANLYVASYANHKILKEGFFEGGYGQSVLFSGTIDGLTIGPKGVAVDGAGNIYIADTDNNRVLVETKTNGVYSTSYTFSSGLSHPDGVAVDGSGNVYIANSTDNTVLVETLSNGSYTLTKTFSGFSNPFRVAVDWSGNVYVADTGNNKVWKETPSEGNYTQTTVVSGLNGPRGVAVDMNGNVYVADQGSGTIWVETLSNGSYSQSALVTGLTGPRAVTLDGSGNLYIADVVSNAVYEMDFADAPTLNFNTTAVGFTSTDSPQTITANNFGNASLVFSGLSYATDFPQDNSNEGTCTPSTTLAANTSCTLPIDFTPGIVNSFNESISLTDNSSNNSTQSISVGGTGIAPTITFTSPESTTLPGGTVGSSYNTNSVSFSATGGTAPYSYSITSGTLPPGLSLSGTGSLTGTPTSANNGNAYNFTVTATDNNRFTGGQGYSLTVGQGTATITISPYTNVTYDATAHTASITTATGYNSVDLSSGVDLTHTTHTNAGSYTADYWTFTDPAGNYASQGPTTITDSIAQATASFNVTPYTVTYNAASHTATGTATGVSDVDLSSGLNFSHTTHTNAGTYSSDYWTFHDVNGNYADKGNTTITDTIGQVTVSPSVFGYSVNYDGNAHSATGSATGVGSVDLSEDLDLSGTVHTAVGNYTDSWSFTDPTGNYASTGGSVSDTIAPIAATATAPAATNLGTFNVGTSTIQTVTFTIQTAGTIGAPVVLTQGTNGLDFTDVLDGTCTTTNGSGNGYPVSSTCTVDVKFTPKYPGPRSGAVLLEDTSGNILATAYVYGIGIAPQINFSLATPVQSTMGGGFSTPKGVAVDAVGKVYLSDSTTSLVQMMLSNCTDSSCVSSIGGGFNQPRGAAVDGAGNVYIADYNNHAVKQIPAGCNSSSCVLTLGGGFHYPEGVAVDGAGNVYVADSGNNAVKEIPASCIVGLNNASCVNTLGGTFAFNWPRGVAVDGSGKIYVADTNNSAVEVMTAGCTLASCVASLGGGFSQPNGVAVDVNGNVYVADAGTFKVTSMTAGCANAACVTNLNGNFSSIYSVALDQRNIVYVADFGRESIVKLDYADAPNLSFNTTTAGFTSTDSPQTVTVRNAGNASLTFTTQSSPTDFPLNSTGDGVCSATTSLAANTSCTLPIDFTPTTNTLLNERLRLTDNNLYTRSEEFLNVPLNGPQPLNNQQNSQSILLSGTGTTPTITFNTPVSSTLPPATLGVPYSGASFTVTGGGSPYTFSSDSVPSGLTLSSAGVLSGTPAVSGTSISITITATDKNGFTGSRIFTLSIGLGEASFDITPYSVTYDGTVHTATGTATGVGSVDLSADLTFTSTSHTNAGSYTTDSWSFHDPSGNYADAGGTIIDTIAKASATVNINSYSVSYDGNTHTATGTAVGVGSANLNADLTLTGTTHTNAGSYTTDAWSFHDASGNYNDASGTVSDTIAKASATVNVTPYNVSYDGNAHTATGTATGVSSANLNADLTLTGTTHTNFGTYTTDAWSFHDASGNYNDASGTVADVITKASASVNVTPYNVSYDGTAHTATGTATGAGSVNLYADLTLTGTTHTNAGSYTTDAWSFHDASGNYNDASGTVSDSIGKASASVNVTPYNVTFDGSSHTATGSATGVSSANLNADLTLTGTTHTNANTYATDAWSFHDASGNYSDASGTVSDTITKASASVNINSYSVTYDGTAHTATGTATGVSSANLNADLTLTGTTHTNAGTYASDAWSFHDASGNYSDASGTVSDAIAKASATVNVTPYNVSYDGSAHTATGTATGVSSANLNADLTLTGTTHTNANTYATDAWSFHDASGNYSDANGTVSDTIGKATAAINVAPYNVSYDGNVHTATGTATGVGSANLNADLTLSGTAHTNALTYATDAWSFTDPNGNYASAAGTVTDIISKVAATISVTPYDVTYDGSAHTATGTATGVGNANLLADLNLTGTTHTNASTYTTDSWSFTDPNGNYTSAIGSVSDTINVATATVTLGSLAQTFTGSPLAATAITNPALLTVNFTYTGTGGTTYSTSSTPPTAVGSYNVVGTISSTNYSGSNTGTLVISKAASQIASLTSNLNPAAAGSSVMLTATISSAAGVPTGSVTFLDNTNTTLGIGTLSGGVATLTTSFTSAQEGANAITVVYGGDSSFQGSSGGSLTQTVVVFSLTPGSGDVTSQTVSAGGTAVYSLNIAPNSGTTFPAAVTLTVSGMPAGATATITPVTWTQLSSTSWSFPANTALSAITLSIRVPASSGMMERKDTIGSKLPPVLWGILLLPFAYKLRRAGKRLGRTLSLLLLLAAGLGAITALSGCGGSSGSSSQSNNYTITVTATSGSVTSTTLLSLTVN
jgi:hypothetical protein